MKRVLTAAVLIPLVLLVIFKAPTWLFVGVLATFALVCADEYFALASVHNDVERPFMMASIVIVFGAILLAYLPGPFILADFLAYAYGLALVIGAVLMLSPFLLLTAKLRSEDFSRALSGAAATWFVLPYVVLPFFALLALQVDESKTGWFFLMLLFLIVWSGDIFAYYVGKSFGRRKLAPRISPGKTWEGAIASVIGAVTVAVLFSYYAPEIQQWLAGTGLVTQPPPASDSFTEVRTLVRPPLWIPALLAIILNVLAQTGDLAESMLKRGAGVKDSGTLFPAHGGVLDRVDALLFAAPAAAILFTLTQKYFFR
jgi:phosphatidate cytidylyltransferase